jgi:ParB family chromosome partitioning protein
MSKQRRLGRGLDYLISSQAGGPGEAVDGAAAEPVDGHSTPSQESPAPAVGAMPVAVPVVPTVVPAAPAGRPLDIPVAKIAPNPFQPRQDFDEVDLEELTRSISVNGIIQPLVVRAKAGGAYELVAGERRLRAATALGLETVPAVVREVADDRMLELALVENIQRSDLNPIEKAEAFRDFLTRLKLTQEVAAERVGIDRATLANHLRLLDLPGDIQKLVRGGALSMSHARTIAAVMDPAIQLDLAKKVVRQGWSVRQLERTVAGLTARPKGGAPRARAGQSAEAAAMEDQMRGLLGTKVRIEEGSKRGTGRIIIEYYSLDDFDRILAVMRR